MDANQPAKRVYTVKPNKECKQCYGSGEVYQPVEYGSLRVILCDCVYDELSSQHPAPTEDENGYTEEFEITLDLSDYDPTYKLDVKEG